MKQFIKLDQLKEFKDIAEVLYIFNKKYNVSKDWYISQIKRYSENNWLDGYLRSQCKEINIGRMIELLYLLQPDKISFVRTGNATHALKPFSWVSYRINEFTNDEEDIMIESEELCDALLIAIGRCYFESKKRNPL